MTKAPTKKRKGPGRKPKAAADKLGEMVRVMMTKEQQATIQAAADREGETISGYMRRMALRGAAGAE